MIEWGVDGDSRLGEERYRSRVLSTAAWRRIKGVMQRLSSGGPIALIGTGLETRDGRVRHFASVQEAGQAVEGASVLLSPLPHMRQREVEEAKRRCTDALFVLAPAGGAPEGAKGVEWGHGADPFVYGAAPSHPETGAPMASPRRTARGGCGAFGGRWTVARVRHACVMGGGTNGFDQGLRCRGPCFPADTARGIQ